jgi:hypothetical protein
VGSYSLTGGAVSLVVQPVTVTVPSYGGISRPPPRLHLLPKPVEIMATVSSGQVNQSASLDCAIEISSSARSRSDGTSGAQILADLALAAKELRSDGQQSSAASANLRLMSAKRTGQGGGDLAALFGVDLTMKADTGGEDDPVAPSYDGDDMVYLTPMPDLVDA